MSGDSHYPFHSHQPDQHNPYPPHSTAAPNQPSFHPDQAFHHDPNAFAYQQHDNGPRPHTVSFDPFGATPQQHYIPPNLDQQQPLFPDHQYQHQYQHQHQHQHQQQHQQQQHQEQKHSQQSQHRINDQPDPRRFGHPSIPSYNVDLSNLNPEFDSNRSDYSGHNTRLPVSRAPVQQHFQANQWNQSSASPVAFGNDFNAAPYDYRPGSSHDHFHQHTPFGAPLQPAFSVKQEADLESIATPPPPPADSTNASPSKPGLRIKLKRNVKTIETSSGAQQAQAQLQIEPPSDHNTNSNMPVGRPSRAAAAAASAGISNVYSDSSVSRSLRSRPAKQQQPGSEEDYEEVSLPHQTVSAEDDEEDEDDRDDRDSDSDDDDDDIEKEESVQTILPRASQLRTPASDRQGRQNVGRAKTIPNQSGRMQRNASSEASSSRSLGRNGGARPRPPAEQQKRKNVETHSQPPRRSTRLCSQPASSQETTIAPLQSRAKSFDINMDSQSGQSHSLGIRGRKRQQAEVQQLGSSDADEQDDDDEDAEGDDDAEGEQETIVKDADEPHEPEPILSRSRSGRVRKQKVQSMAESEDSDAVADEDVDGDADEDDEDVRPTRRSSSRRLRSNALDGFVAKDDDEEEDDEGEYGVKRTTRSSGRLRRGNSSTSNRLAEMAAKKRAANGRGRPPKRKVIDDEFEVEGDETPEEDHISGAEDDPLDIHSDEPEGSQGKSYSLRQRKKVNYSLVPPPASPPRDGFGRAIRNNRGRGGNGAYDLDPVGGEAGSGGAGPGLPMPFPGRGKKGKEGWNALPTSMTGKDYARIFGDPVDSSDDELQNNAFRKPGGPAALGGGAAGAGGLLGAGGAGGAGGPPGGLTGSGGTDSFGRIKKSGDPLADVDPLGVDMNIDFDSVGGLDGHIQQLKEMVMLPLLYPEVFQRFKVTPPRGVLFHGPPGTGKTLVARALAASCSTEGQQVSFFMRKGADCLSKWVGEAERQLRLLFEEARASQPSIIFFDEIDGLAPVRSSKQDQIHASIVSTMLALMDGMDGRGQVVVIGATNRPDSVDPALRRPGRFDREFYFPLPSLEARKSIINIHTRKWEPPLDDDFKARLAEVTKGYGGADLRALCTEAALNAIQRRYPQIYSTTDRLLLDPASIQVDAKDFMMSVNKIVPSSARASASAAAPLPERLAPLLGSVVQDAISVLDRILPPVSKRNPLEEALWEDDTFVPKGLTSGLSAADMLAGDRGFGREMLLQSFEAQRVYRPRMLVHGDVGMGQGAVGAALLQHLEGYHVQSLDIGTLLGDSARTPEAAIIQLFVEAKRHKPSVLYIPGIVHWSRSVSESVKTTFKALLDGLTDADPVMLLGIAEAPLEELDDEVHSWFDFLDDDVVEIPRPDEESRRDFFKEIFDHVIRPPTEFPDALPRRKRVLEVLPKAPPRPPRKLTQAELQQQADNDAKLLEHLKYRLGPVLAELRKKFKKFTRDVWDEYNLRELTQTFPWKREKGKITVELHYYRPGLAAQAAEDANDEEQDRSMLETEADIAAKRGITAAQFMGPPPGSITEMAADEPAADAAPTESTGAVAAGDDVEMTNGDSAVAPAAAAVNGSDAIAASAEGESSAVDAVPPPSSQPNGISAADPSATSDDASTAANPADADATAAADTSLPTAATSNGIDKDYVTRTMPIWTTNLEKMQKRLYYNGYLSCSAFMEDIQKIVENAEEAAEVDQDRVFKAHQLRNLAIVLMDQYIDAGFREECDRMALRQMAREQEAKEATEKAKQSAEEAAAKKAEAAKGERQSARIAGKEPESAGLEGSAERGSKRQRSVSGQLAETGEGDAAAAAAMEVDKTATETSLAAAAAIPAFADGEEEARKRARLTSPSADTANAPSETISTEPATAAAAATSVGAAEAEAEPEPEAEAEAEAEPHPPLTYTGAAYTHLQSHILTSTSVYNIDQLSRLRAACFNAIWTHRSDWDRDELIGKLIEITAKSAAAVRREKKTLGQIEG